MVAEYVDILENPDSGWLIARLYPHYLVSCICQFTSHIQQR